LFLAANTLTPRDESGKKIMTGLLFTLGWNLVLD